MKTAGRIGFNADRAVNYHADSRGTELAYDAVAETVCMARMGRPIAADWSRTVQDDFEMRIE